MEPKGALQYRLPVCCNEDISISGAFWKSLCKMQLLYNYLICTLSLLDVYSDKWKGVQNLFFWGRLDEKKWNFNDCLTRIKISVSNFPYWYQKIGNKFKVLRVFQIPVPPLIRCQTVKILLTNCKVTWLQRNLTF